MGTEAPIRAVCLLKLENFKLEPFLPPETGKIVVLPYKPPEPEL
jgi:hypothetical protein